MASEALTGRPHLLAGEDLPPRPRQRRSLAKRRRLEAAALALFGERGYRQTGVEDIARRARVAVGGFYLHYRSKRQLLLALMDELLALLNALTLRPGSGDVRVQLRAMLASAFDADLAYLGAYRAWEEAVLVDAGLATRHAEIQTWSMRRVEGVLRHLQRLPGARPGVRLRELSRVLDTYFWSLLSHAVRLRRADLARALDATTHLIYHAMFTDNAGRERT